jgi:hypothetical protein
MIAITTKYIGPTNYRGSRVSAVAWHPNGKREAVTVPYRDEIDSDGNFRAAAVAWVRKFCPTCAVSAVSGDTGEGVHIFLAVNARAARPIEFLPVDAA